MIPCYRSQAYYLDPPLIGISTVFIGGILEASCGHLEVLWSTLGLSWRHLGASWRHLEGILEASWEHLDAF